LGIPLVAVTAKALPHFRVDAFQGFKDGNWGKLAIREWRLLELLSRVTEKTDEAQGG
jgi:hypothetical protein